MIAAVAKRCLLAFKKTLTDRRRLALFLSVLVLLIIGGRWIGKELKRGWQQAQVYGIGGGVKEYVRSPNVSDEYNDYMEWLIDGLVRSRRPWSMEDAERLIAVLNNPPTEKYLASIYRHDTTPREAEWMLTYSPVMGSISERLRHNDPMAPGVKELLSQTLLDQLDVPIPSTQLAAVQAVANARLVMMPIVRAKLVAMQLATDDKRLADTIGAQLGRFDYYEQLRREGNYSERGVDPIPAP